MWGRRCDRRSTVIALVAVRDGVLPAGAEEVVAECGGRAVLVGAGAARAAKDLAGLSTEVQVWEAEGYQPAAWSAASAPVLAREPVVVLPASADGRDLAPRLAHRLGRPLLAGAIEITPDRVVIARWGGLAVEDVVPPAQLVATLEPGVRGFARGRRGRAHGGPPRPHTATAHEPHHAGEAIDATVLEVLPPDPATMDLSEARRIVAGGAGPRRRPHGSSSSPPSAAALGACSAPPASSPTGAGSATSARSARPAWSSTRRLYVAFGISGAVQHTSGLGQPDHIISVNTDPSLPDDAAGRPGRRRDANAVLDELRDPAGPGRGADDARAAECLTST